VIRFFTFYVVVYCFDCRENAEGIDHQPSKIDFIKALLFALSKQDEQPTFILLFLIENNEY